MMRDRPLGMVNSLARAMMLVIVGLVASALTTDVCTNAFDAVPGITESALSIE
jgi:hypothetical protein